MLFPFFPLQQRAKSKCIFFHFARSNFTPLDYIYTVIAIFSVISIFLYFSCSSPKTNTVYQPTTTYGGGGGDEDDVSVMLPVIPRGV